MLLSAAIALMALGLTAALPVFRTPHLTAVWGNSGGLPAIALVGSAPEPVIILPGSHDDGATLGTILYNSGHRWVSRMIMPEGSPYVYGARAIAGKLPIRELTVLTYSRSRIDGRDLRSKLTAGGTGISTFTSERGQECHFTFNGWNCTFLRLKDGLFTYRLIPAEATPQLPAVTLEMKDTGELEIRLATTPPTIHLLHKTNRRGSLKIPLNCRK
jgi:hypothetical protein